ncbi:hypothetical protein HDU96_007157 [Phlyctochytrium bullatum]|nr:hypothetical protein HDU96_007157 [Phlyctochytrium bullatum]
MTPAIAQPLVTPPTTPPFEGRKVAVVGEPTLLDQNDYVLKDIRGHSESSNTQNQLVERIELGLSSKTVPFVVDSKSKSPIVSPSPLLRSIPTLVLYDDRGLDLFDQITYLDEYYLTNAEIQIFTDWGNEIISTCVQDGGILVELGVGSMRKTKFLLDAIVRQQKSVTYYALDLSEESLRGSLKTLAENFPTIRFVGLLGTYEDSLGYIANNVPTHAADGTRLTRTILWLGSSIGNLSREEAAEFLGKVCQQALSVGDTFLCGIDRRNTPTDVKLAYDDPKGITREFIMNGLDHVDRILGGNGTIDRRNFEYVSIYNDAEGRHEAYYKCLKAHTLRLPNISIDLEEGEFINIEYSVKYSAKEVSELCDRAGLYHTFAWSDNSNRYGVHLFSRPPFHLRSTDVTSKKSYPGSMGGVPTMRQFEEIWKAWDTVTCTMIKSGEYLEKPIDLRHPYIFYLGHIPAFLDIQLSRCLGEKFTEPEFYAEIFERGIDPDLDDNTKCHPHSKVPDAWPSHTEVLQYRDRVRQRVRKVIEAFYAKNTKFASLGRLARVLWMCYEHDAMHLETILYMQVQCKKVRPPEGILCPPNFLRKTKASDIKAIPPTSFLPSIPENATVVLGYNDPIGDESSWSALEDAVFGWDNERPARAVELKSLALRPPSAAARIQSRPVTAFEYYQFLCAQPQPVDASLIPASWEHFSRENASATTVRTVFGPISLANVPNWPVLCSHVQASAYMKHVGASRFPSEEELVYLRRVQEKEELSALPNVGFKLWYPEDAVEGLVLGNGWEWTDTLMDSHEGFEASPLYPGYTADFL